MNNTIKIEKHGDHWFVINTFLRIYGTSDISEKSAFIDYGRALNNFIDIHIKRGTLKETLINFSNE